MAQSSARGRGNYDRDDEWMAWMEKHSSLEVIDPDAEDIPFPAKLRWEGDADDDDSPWKIPPPGKRCAGKAYLRDVDGDYIVDKNNVRLMRPCYNWPMKGGKVCLKHGGGIVRVRKKAIERMASALDAASGALIRIALDDNAQDKDRINAIKEIMDRVGLRGGIEVDVKDPGYLDVLKGMFKSEEASGEDDGA